VQSEVTAANPWDNRTPEENNAAIWLSEKTGLEMTDPSLWELFDLYTGTETRFPGSFDIDSTVRLGDFASQYGLGADDWSLPFDGNPQSNDSLITGDEPVLTADDGGAGGGSDTGYPGPEELYGEDTQPVDTSGDQAQNVQNALASDVYYGGHYVMDGTVLPPGDYSGAAENGIYQNSAGEWIVPENVPQYGTPEFETFMTIMESTGGTYHPPGSLQFNPAQDAGSEYKAEGASGMQGALDNLIESMNNPADPNDFTTGDGLTTADKGIDVVANPWTDPALKHLSEQDKLAYMREHGGAMMDYYENIMAGQDDLWNQAQAIARQEYETTMGTARDNEIRGMTNQGLGGSLAQAEVRNFDVAAEQEYQKELLDWAVADREHRLKAGDQATTLLANMTNAELDQFQLQIDAMKAYSLQQQEAARLELEAAMANQDDARAREIADQIDKTARDIADLEIKYKVEHMNRVEVPAAASDAASNLFDAGASESESDIARKQLLLDSSQWADQKELRDLQATSLSQAIADGDLAWGRELFLAMTPSPQLKWQMERADDEDTLFILQTYSNIVAASDDPMKIAKAEKRIEEWMEDKYGV